MLSETNQTRRTNTRLILYDSTYARYLKQSNSQRQKTERWLPGSGGGGGIRCRVSFLQEESSRDLLHNNVNVVSATELHT